MTRWILAAGAAALALAGPAIAERGGNGKDKGGGKHAAAKAERIADGADRGQRAARPADGDERRSTRRVDRDQRTRAGLGGLASAVIGDELSGGHRDRLGGWRSAGLAGGCPPGLAKKNNGCLPPGLARKLALGDRLPEPFLRSRFVPSAYRDSQADWYGDTANSAYRFGDGYIYRVDRNDGLIESMIPLLGGGYGVGQMLPAGYDIYNVPYQYRSLYPDNDEHYYRYGDGAIYQVDRSSGLIDSVAAVLARDLSVGSMLPVGYDAYNVPFAYRDRYNDSDEAWYRYNDGQIYQIDPTTRLVQAVVAAIL